MSVAPFPIQCKRDGKWVSLQTDELLPGDMVSVGESRPHDLIKLTLNASTTPYFATARQQAETNVPADILLVRGTCIVNEAMLSGESTPLLKESIELLEGDEHLDVDNVHKGVMLFSGTKVLQSRGGGTFSGL